MNPAQNELCKMAFIKYGCALRADLLVGLAACIPVKFKEQPSVTSNDFQVKFNLKEKRIMFPF